MARHTQSGSAKRAAGGAGVLHHGGCIATGRRPFSVAIRSIDAMPRRILSLAEVFAEWTCILGGTKDRSATACSIQSTTSYPVPRESSPRSWSRLSSSTFPVFSSAITSSGQYVLVQPAGVSRSSSRNTRIAIAPFSDVAGLPLDPNALNLLHRSAQCAAGSRRTWSLLGSVSDRSCRSEEAAIRGGVRWRCRWDASADGLALLVQCAWQEQHDHIDSPADHVKTVSSP